MSDTSIPIPSNDPAAAIQIRSDQESVVREKKSSPSFWGYRIRSELGIVRTRILWGRRLAGLGMRTFIGRPVLLNYPRAVLLGARITLSDDFVLADLCPGRGPYPKIRIGDDCTIMYRFQCNAAEGVKIGKYVLVASNVLITDSDHVLEPGVPITRDSALKTSPVEIQDNCWLGQNCVILKGVTVGHDSIVGANSVVTHDVPPCSIVAGNPARVIRTITDSHRTMDLTAAGTA